MTQINQKWCDCDPGKCKGGEYYECRQNSPLLSVSEERTPLDMTAIAEAYNFTEDQWRAMFPGKKK